MIRLDGPFGTAAEAPTPDNTGGKSDVYVYTPVVSEEFKDFAYIDSGVPITLTSSLPYNLNMPVLQVKDVERLDPLELTSTGQYIPRAEPIDARALRDFSFSRDEHTLERAVGVIRLFFERPTSFTANEDTVFTTDDDFVFRPIETQTVSASGMRLNTGQNITATEMDSNKVFNQRIRYYFYDVAVKSDEAGAGETLLSQGDAVTVSGYISEGWRSRTVEESLAFSTREQIRLTFTSTFNDGLPTTGQAIRVIYDWSPEVLDIQEFVDDDDNRVVTTDTLIKHFQPAFVDIAITYEGNLNIFDAEIFVRNFINGIQQGEYFEISDLVSLLYQNGATRVILPLEVFVLIVNTDRTLTGVRFTDRYRTNRRIHFVARNVDIVKAG